MKWSPIRILVLVVALALGTLGAAGCKSKKERQRDYDKCVRTCVTKHVPGGTGGASVETALRRATGGGQCLTKCKQAKNPKGFFKKIGRMFDD